jgi:hypothetical protein
MSMDRESGRGNKRARVTRGSRNQQNQQKESKRKKSAKGKHYIVHKPSRLN